MSLDSPRTSTNMVLSQGLESEKIKIDNTIQEECSKDNKHIAPSNEVDSDEVSENSIRMGHTNRDPDVKIDTDPSTEENDVSRSVNAPKILVDGSDKMEKATPQLNLKPKAEPTVAEKKNALKTIIMKLNNVQKELQEKNEETEVLKKGNLIKMKKIQTLSAEKTNLNTENEELKKVNLAQTDKIEYLCKENNSLKAEIEVLKNMNKAQSEKMETLVMENDFFQTKSKNFNLKTKVKENDNIHSDSEILSNLTQSNTIKYKTHSTQKDPVNEVKVSPELQDKVDEEHGEVKLAPVISTVTSQNQKSTEEINAKNEKLEENRFTATGDGKRLLSLSEQSGDAKKMRSFMYEDYKKNIKPITEVDELELSTLLRDISRDYVPKLDISPLIENFAKPKEKDSQIEKAGKELFDANLNQEDFLQQITNMQEKYKNILSKPSQQNDTVGMSQLQHNFNDSKFFRDYYNNENNKIKQIDQSKMLNTEDVKSKFKGSKNASSKNSTLSPLFCCVPCTKDISQECMKCRYCLDKTKYGGPNLHKQKCVERICEKKGKRIRKVF